MCLTGPPSYVSSPAYNIELYNMGTCQCAKPTLPKQRAVRPARPTKKLQQIQYSTVLTPSCLANSQDSDDKPPQCRVIYPPPRRISKTPPRYPTFQKSVSNVETNHSGSTKTTAPDKSDNSLAYSMKSSTGDNTLSFNLMPNEKSKVEEKLKRERSSRWVSGIRL